MGKNDPQSIATACISVVEEAMTKLGNLTFSSPPKFIERQIIEYDSRMRVFGMEIFNGACYISSINYYLTSQDQQSDNPCGTFILYIEESLVGRFLHALGHKKIDDDDEEAVLNVVGDFCTTLADSYKNKIVSLGYQNLMMSAPTKHHNFVPEGINFHYDEYGKCEVSFFLWKEKAMAIDITLKAL